MMFALAATCTDLEHGCNTFKLPPLMINDEYGQANRSAKMFMAPNLTFLNVEHENARRRLMNGIYMPIEVKPQYQYPDGYVESRRLIDMIRATSTICNPCAALSFINMRKHT